MKSLVLSFLNDNPTPSTPSSKDNLTPTSSSTIGNSTTRSSDVYSYGVGVVTVLAIGVCVLFELK